MRHRLLHALCSHALGALSAALRGYDALLRADGEHVAWYHQECARWLLGALARPLDAVSMDAELDEHVKEAWCKRTPPSELRRERRERGAPLEREPLVAVLARDIQTPPAQAIGDDDATAAERAKRLLDRPSLEDLKDVL